MNPLKALYLVLFHVIANNLPWYFKYILGNKLRNFLFRKITGSGKNVSIGRNSNIMNITKLIRTGDNVIIGENFRLVGFTEPVIIGNNVSIAFDCVMITNQRTYDDISKSQRDHDYRNERIVIEDEVIIGGGAYIMKGVKISKGAYVGARSVVTKDVPSYAVVAGVPAKVLKIRGQDEQKSAAEENISAPKEENKENN